MGCLESRLFVDLSHRTLGIAYIGDQVVASRVCVGLIQLRVARAHMQLTGGLIVVCFMQLVRRFACCALNIRMHLYAFKNTRTYQLICNHLEIKYISLCIFSSGSSYMMRSCSYVFLRTLCLTLGL